MGSYFVQEIFFCLSRLTRQQGKGTILIPIYHFYPLTSTETHICRYVFEMHTLTPSWRRPLSYLLCKSMDWFLYDNGLCHERVKFFITVYVITKLLLNENYPPQGIIIWLKVVGFCLLITYLMLLLTLWQTVDLNSHRLSP